METLIVHPRTPKELATVEAILRALDVPFHKQSEGFDPSFSGKTDRDKPADPTRKQGDDNWKLE
ncbi:hypothetical protein GZH53_01390 [Flavihumibacter sp. R14]|nr:hypothetical protein [Flavihumibacter soli]